jgi:hypothetical protein
MMRFEGGKYVPSNLNAQLIDDTSGENVKDGSKNIYLNTNVASY